MKLVLDSTEVKPLAVPGDVKGKKSMAQDYQPPSATAREASSAPSKRSP
jgi:hypothetical protein